MARSASVNLLPATMTGKVQGSLAAKEVAQDTVKRILPTTTLNWPTLQVQLQARSSPRCYSFLNRRDSSLTAYSTTARRQHQQMKVKNDHRNKIFQFKQVERRSLKKNQGFNGIDFFFQASSFQLLKLENLLR